MVVLCGLRLHLAEWDTKMGVICTGTDTRHCTNTPELFCWASKGTCLDRDVKTDRVEEGRGFFNCPLYSAPVKDECITYIPLKTIETFQHLHLLGIALLLC